jgi:hypothetical protein
MEKTLQPAKASALETGLGINPPHTSRVSDSLLDQLGPALISEGESSSSSFAEGFVSDRFVAQKEVV